MSELAGYQLELLAALRPLVGRLDPRLVTPRSGLQAGGGVVELVVEPPGERVPTLFLHAAADDCTVGIAEGEVLEWHGGPQHTEDLVSHVLELVARYLSGVTVIERYNRFDRLLRTEYYYGADEQPSLVCRLARSSRPLVFPRGVQRTVKRQFRFLLGRDDARSAEPTTGGEGEGG